MGFMAEEEEEEIAKASNFFQVNSSHFLEITCKSSGKVRRFSVGTEAGFAVQCINQKVDSGVPLASYIEAVKEGEEPITFGPSSVLIDYGDGWKLQTVTNEGFEEVKLLEEPYKEFPDVIEPMRDDVQSATDLDFHLIVPPLLEENKTIISEPVSDVESQSLLKLDFTDAFTTDEVFNSRDELIKWARDVGRSVGNLSSMAEEEVVNAFNITPPQQCSSSFLEVNCKSSGKVRRFSVGTEASFALELINQKLVSGDPSAAYIEAFKEGEEPISFGPNSLLIDYGDGWKLQTVTNEGFEKQNDMDLPYEDFPNIIEPRKENVEFATDYDLELEDPLQEVENPIASEPVSDIYLQSEKLDLTDTFKTDAVFDSRVELVKWARDVGRSVGTVIVKKKSDFGVSGRTPRLAIGCERGANNLSSMGEEKEEVENPSTLLQPPKPFIEIICKSSGKVRRFAVGTDARFALQLINKNLDSGIPLALYIEADKEGEEPISFGHNAVLVDYGDGWKLQTVIDYEAALGMEKGEPPTDKQLPNVTGTDGLQRSASGSERNFSYLYLGRILLVLIFIVLFAVILTLGLENLPRLILYVTSLM
ncbi:maltase-glucoamylase, intestinal protein [Thalictrum thalictroides]|uniref:Maltase-glucoamylase, intestinal protein n=1 Tax=Thalictrum thalictroides TaxID=46969 RepID=A0A7J6WBG7_THATH|nr:maltase-glucoamylase, intestinal protein [Thalictrum thalictroides]